jgi:hypothetical protein
MKPKFIVIFTLLLSVQLSAQQISFDSYFEKKTLRFDFILAGDSEHQMAFLDGFREEPVWGGPLKNLVENFDYGEYAVELYDKESNKLIYSTHFSTLFQEWRTTAEAKVMCKSFNNSAVMPFPKKNAIVKLLARDKDSFEFKPLFEGEIDPASIFIDRSMLTENDVREIQYKGSPNEKVDLVFIAEGYTKIEQEKFYHDVKRLSDSLFAHVPFDKRRDDFNVWAVALVSEDSKTDYSGKGIWNNTALNSGYYTFGLDRYLTTTDYKSVRNAVWNVPCDAIIVLVNTETYGGGGIYNHYSMVTADDRLSPKVLAHEFGHGFGGLADEYFESTVAYDDSFYNLKTEPWEPNITTLVDFDKKWKDMLPKNTPIPTAVDKSQPHKLGVYEGGGYLAKGIYRPVDHCMMRDYHPFCPVCQRSINQVIDFLTDK